MDAVTERQKAFQLYHDALGTTEKPSKEEFDEAFKGGLLLLRGVR